MPPTGTLIGVNPGPGRLTCAAPPATVAPGTPRGEGRAMGETTVSYATYAQHRLGGAQAALRAKLYRPDGAADALPLVIWFHSGGFHSGDIESNGHNRLARQFAHQGYALAVPQYRLGALAEDLRPGTGALLPRLVEDAARHMPWINPDFTGPRALAAVEDAAAFLQWVETRRAEFGLNGRWLLGGSSAGAMTALNLLMLAPALGLDLPAIPTAFAMSGAFAYPSFQRETPTRILALHGTGERQIPVAPIRAFAYRAPHCTLLEDAAHQHGDTRLNRAEPLRRAIRRLADFDRGAAIAPARTGPRDRTVKRENRICLVTCVKNEGPFLLEWLAHNRAIGVTDLLVFSNDCDDGTAELLDRLDAMGIVHHVPNPSMALGSDQHLNLATACAPYHRAVRRADYVIVSDVDEFIQVDCADGTLNGLLAVTGYPDVISISELVYGFGGIERFEDRPVAEQFRASDALVPGPGSPRRGVKSITRVSKDVQAYSNHRPRLRPEVTEGLDWVDGAGQPVPRDFITENRRGLDPAGRYVLARVNHFTLRSGESMLVKFQRGDAVRPGRMREKYFQDRNGRALIHDADPPWLPALAAELARLMADAGLARLHAECVAAHRAKIAALKADPDFAGIWQAIRAEVARPLGSGDPEPLVAE